MRESLMALEPVLELMGWLVLLGAIAFFLAAAQSRRSAARWASTPSEVAVLEGQQCLVWNGADGTSYSYLLEELEPCPDPLPLNIYYQARNPSLPYWRAPQSNARFLRNLGWALLVTWLLCNLLPLAFRASL